MGIWQHIEEHIESTTGASAAVGLRDSSGVSICFTDRLQCGDNEYFIKANDIRFGEMFAAEAQALTEMAATGTIRVPQVICHGDDGHQCYIVMEYLTMPRRADSRQLAERLVAMHRVTADRFGWHRDNTIGLTPQHNHQHDDWLTFWREHRLGFQLKLAEANGVGGQLQQLGAALMEDCPVLFADYSPAPSMLHGDLWSGNYGGLDDGTPVVFDPALYFGDREADIAMTTLFGGFSADFYREYESLWPLEDGYELRRIFYNLYHVLNHLNLFGGTYHDQAIAMMRHLLAEL